MSERTTVNVEELEYTFGYFRELSPAFLQFAVLANGFAPPSGPVRYLELGFGQGVSLAVHAAACDGEYWGNDRNPAHVAHARSLAAASGAQPVLVEDSFAELAARADLPEFDIIALHGIWTWISDQDRAVIADLVRRRLAPGGILYVSYNCLASWAPLSPLRKLLLAHAQSAPAGQSVMEKMAGALEFAQRLIDAGALHFKYNPIVAMQLRALRARNSVYLAHEFFSSDWQPTMFADVARQLEPAGLAYVTTAAFLEGMEAFALSAAERGILAPIDDVVLRETAREMLMNTHFRQDLFMKAPRRLSAGEHQAALSAQRFVLSAAPDETALEVSGPTAPIRLDPAHFAPIVAALAADSGRPKSVAELRGAGVFGDRPASAVAQELAALVACQHLHVVQDAPAAAPERCRNLNRLVCARMRDGSEILPLASPVVGGGVAVNRTDQLFLLALSEALETPEQLADFAWASLQAAGRVVYRDGAPIVGADNNRAELRRLAARLLTRRLPILNALGIEL